MTKKLVSALMILATSGSVFMACNNAAKADKEKEKKDTAQQAGRPGDNVVHDNSTITQGGVDDSKTAADAKGVKDDKVENPGVIVGNDKDAHGCIGSAGYTWSEVKGDCIRMFEAGTALNPVDESLHKNMVAYIVFNDDQSKVELFTADIKGSKILQRKGSKGSYTWESGTWKLSSGTNGYVLKDGSKTMYQQ